ncbi:MAG: hypothetical protein JXR63_02720 [Spirochaetales bacterium]|nr:hypothetical protein [Spirochaetales bacterium]
MNRKVFNKVKIFIVLIALLGLFSIGYQVFKLFAPKSHSIEARNVSSHILQDDVILIMTSLFLESRDDSCTVLYFLEGESINKVELEFFFSLFGDEKIHKHGDYYYTCLSNAPDGVQYIVKFDKSGSQISIFDTGTVEFREFWYKVGDGYSNIKFAGSECFIQFENAIYTINLDNLQIIREAEKKKEEIPVLDYEIFDVCEHKIYKYRDKIVLKKSSGEELTLSEKIYDSYFFVGDENSIIIWGVIPKEKDFVVGVRVYNIEGVLIQSKDFKSLKGLAYRYFFLKYLTVNEVDDGYVVTIQRRFLERDVFKIDRNLKIVDLY